MNKAPRHDKVISLLQRGIAFQQTGNLDQAAACYDKALEKDKHSADAWHLSGVVASLRGNPGLAAKQIERAIQLRSNNPYFWVNLANAQETLGNDTAAEGSLRSAIRLDPSIAAAHNNLGNLLVRAGRDDEAILAYDQTLVVQASHWSAGLALSRLLLKKERFPEAGALASMLLKAQPDNVLVLKVLATSKTRLRRYDEAECLLASVLALQPDDLDALIDYAAVLDKAGKAEAAIRGYEEVLKRSPANEQVVNSLKRLLVFSANFQGANSLDQDVLSVVADNSHYLSSCLFTLNYDETLDNKEILARHLDWGRRFSPVPEKKFFPERELSMTRRLRVGYLSSDFKQHSVSYFIENIFAYHRRDNVESFAYSLTSDHDHVTKRIKESADHFVEAKGLTPEALATRINEDRIDIAIDLEGHTGGGEIALKTLGLRAAPVQISWLGYPNTSGVAAIDYKISDGLADPIGEGDDWNSETVLRLPDCFHCYRPDPEAAADFDATPPSLKSGFITFGSFNVLPKISLSCYAAWASILTRVPRSKLVLKNRFLREKSTQSRVLGNFTKHGISADRILLSSDQDDFSEHLLRYREIDIALDPFPYNGTTTTCEALWMGVPVMTFLGNRHAARVGGSLLTAIGHPELVANDVDDYIARTIDLANDPLRLRSLHAGLRADMARSPLCDAERFVTNLEAAYRKVWQDYCAAHH